MNIYRLATRCGIIAVLLLASSAGQIPQPDAGPVGQLGGTLADTVLPPVLQAAEAASGYDFDQEDIRVQMDMEFTKGDVNLIGFLIGSARTEIEATLNMRVEMRVISFERLRALFEGQNFYNITDENRSATDHVYVAADVLRASLAGEAFQQFQDRQEAALRIYLERTFPELDLSNVQVAWINTSPGGAADDDNIVEPPIVIELDVAAQYRRTDSLQSVFSSYTQGKGDSKRSSYIQDLKADAGDPLRSRDFFSAAAYTQLLNLTAQPGWAIDVNLTLPEGYEFTYFNQDAVRKSKTQASMHLDALDREGSEKKVFLASITHKRGVALTLFATMWTLGLLLAIPGRFIYVRRRLRLYERKDLADQLAKAP